MEREKQKCSMRILTCIIYNFWEFQENNHKMRLQPEHFMMPEKPHKFSDIFADS